MSTKFSLKTRAKKLSHKSDIKQNIKRKKSKSAIKGKSRRSEKLSTNAPEKKYKGYQLVEKHHWDISINKPDHIYYESKDGNQTLPGIVYDVDRNQDHIIFKLYRKDLKNPDATPFFYAASSSNISKIWKKMHANDIVMDHKIATEKNNIEMLGELSTLELRIEQLETNYAAVRSENAYLRTQIEDILKFLVEKSGRTK